MGLGNLGKTDLIFARQFRFIIGSEHLSEHYNLSVHIDWIKKNIILDVYEVVEDGKVPIHDWADAMERGDYHDESLNLVVFDGCGAELYGYKFHDLKITGRENYFSYESSNISLHKVTLSFGKSEKTNVTYNMHAVMENKPMAEFHHLNEKSWVK